MTHFFSSSTVFHGYGCFGFSFHMIWLNGISGVCYPCSLVPTKVLETVILLESPSYINIVKMSIIIVFQSVKIWKRSLTADVIEASMSAAASYNSTVKFNVDLCVCKKEGVRENERERRYTCMMFSCFWTNDYTIVYVVRVCIVAWGYAGTDMHADIHTNTQAGTHM